MINPPPPHAAVGADDANDYEDANDIENNAAEEDEIEGGKAGAAVDVEEEDGDYVGDDEDGGQGRRTRSNFSDSFLHLAFCDNMRNCAVLFSSIPTVHGDW